MIYDFTYIFFKSNILYSYYYFKLTVVFYYIVIYIYRIQYSLLLTNNITINL